MRQPLQTSSKEKTSEAYGVTQLLKQRKGFIVYARQLIDDIQGRIQTDQTKQFWEFKLGLLQKQKEHLDENNQCIWKAYESYGDSEDKAIYDEIDTRLQKTIIAIREKLESLQLSSKSISTVNEAAMKLPKISVPTFDGSYLKWTQFKELFIQLVHKQPINEIQKMYYLISNLSGEAHALIQHLPVSGQNYDVAWEILKHRYDNERLLVTSLLNKLMEQSSIQTESAYAIKRLHDVTKECLMSFEALGVQVQHWDAILIHIILKKMDKVTHSLYEQSLSNPRALDTMKHVLEFLEVRFQSLEALNHKSAEKSEKPTKVRSSSLLASTNGLKCYVCKQAHQLYACKEFFEKSTEQRLEVVNKNQLCRNCLKAGHRATACTSGVCVKCRQKHNTLLHRNPEDKKFGQEVSNQLKRQQPTTSSSSIKTSLMTKTEPHEESYILLGTIEVAILTSDDQTIKCRAILDSGLQINCITERLAKKLHAKGVVCPINIQGVGRSTDRASRRTSICLQSREMTYSMQLEAFILPQITANQPSRYLNTTSWSLPTNIKLADPHFYQPGPVDILIGAEQYYHIMRSRRINLGQNLPVLQSSAFGWVVAGRVKLQGSDANVGCYICTQESINLNSQIERFWQLENIEDLPRQTTAERNCETFFKETTRRTNSGRYIVRLPFSNDSSALGDSKDLALARFVAIERKLAKDPSLKKEYQAFMTEYKNLGHMTEVNFNEISGSFFFLPHHCVVKPDSETTKLRVVFDASAKTSSNISLNDLLHTGPKIQEDLMTVLLRFRLPRYVCTADIEKMYRQVLVSEEDRKFQLIVWRENPQDSIKYFQLNTVTYGMTAAQ